MSIDETLDRVRDELADEVASDVRVPSFEGVLARRARRRRLQATAGGAALVVVAAGVVGGVAATRPDASRSVPPAATVSVSPPPTAVTSPPASASPTTSPTTSASTAPTSPQTYPAKGSSYVVVPGGDQLFWTDLKTGAHGHFGPADGSQLSDPSVSADGRRVAFLANVGPTANYSVDYWNLDTRAGDSVVPGTLGASSGLLGISPDGKRVAFFEVPGGISVATIGSSARAATVLPHALEATWSGNDALNYLPGPGDCAVERRSLGTSATRCLLPTATLQALSAPNGAPWAIDAIRGAADTDRLALDVTARNGHGPVTGAVAVLDPAAEATPFHVLSDTVASGELAFPTFPGLVDKGSRIVYVVTRSGGNMPAMSTIDVVPVAGGRPAVVASGSGVGLGATSGSA